MYDAATCTNIFDQTKKTAPPVINMHFLHFAIFSFIFTCLLIITISIFTHPIPEKYIEGLTFFSKTTPQLSLVIPSSKGCGKNHFCAATDLSAINVRNELSLEEIKDSKESIDDENVNKFEKYTQVKKVGFVRKAFYFICGIEKEINIKEATSTGENILELELDTSDPYWTKICDLSAIGVISLTGFILAFFNKFY